jgi:leucyl aminopeptidase
MELTLRRQSPMEAEVALVAVLVFSEEKEPTGPAAELDERLQGAISRAMRDGDFRGREEDRLSFHLTGEGGPRRAVVLGAGVSGEADPDLFRRVAGRAVRHAESLSVREVVVALPDPGPVRDEVGAARMVQAAVEGLALAAWDFRELSTREVGADDGPSPLVERGGVFLPEPGEVEMESLESALEFGAAIAAGQNLARDLQWRPGNVATPTHLAGVAEELARNHGFASRILGPEEMEEESMGALLSVARGSDQEPRLIVLEHWGGEPGDPPLALVGKGLTFDSGGISIKPAKGMESMKYDMSGGAAVLGAMLAVGILDLPINVVGVVPSSENLINGSANKPGDVIRTRAGKTVEIINTDAEGRLILADALSYTLDEYSPAAVVDLATLTGAVVVALGHHAAGLLGTDDDLMEELKEAGVVAGERCWPLPLWPAYRKQLRSEVADLKNVGGRPAGTITAGWFLSEFVGEASWAHLDIAGTAYGESDLPYHRKGGFGFPTRLLVEWVRGRAD